MAGRRAPLVAVAVAVAAVSCAGSTGTGPEQMAEDGQDPAVASASLFADIAQDEPGCTAAVNDAGEVVWAGAFGAADLDTDDPLTTETVVDIGSTAKQFTATAVALLADRGEFGLDDPVADHLDLDVTWGDQVSVSDLIHHTSGIADYIDLLGEVGVDTTDPADQGDALDVLAGTDLAFAPGTAFDYSNSNYVLLAEVVAAVDGRDLGAYVEDEVFGPLELAATMAPGEPVEAMATSYERVDDDWVVADSPWTQLGDGGVQTTPSELVRWGEQYWAPTLAGGALADRWFEGAVVDDEGGRYGLGIVADEVDGRRTYHHSGGWSGFETGFVVDPDRRVAVAVTCTTPDGPVTAAVADDLADLWR